ncbi:MAG: NAD(P)H-dependent oxidoreductase subunit E [Bacillus subtilis]|nr:NAD(P)H-dependent oxidoreductase subunit E [Bacillus subtilis]
MNESIAKINGVVTFYGQFSIDPKGDTIIGVCLGTACYVRGSQGILDAFSDELKIKVGDDIGRRKIHLASDTLHRRMRTWRRFSPSTRRCTATAPCKRPKKSFGR